jgi:hypothetical protein
LLITPVISDPHNTWVLLDSETTNGTVNQFWYALNCKGVANTVTLNDTSGLSTVVELLIGEYQSGTPGGLLALDAHAAAKSAAGGTVASGNCTTKFPNDLLIGWQSNETGNAISAGTIGGGAATVRENQSQVTAFEDNNAAGNSAGANAASFGGAQTTWSCGIAAFNVNAPAGGAGDLLLLGVGG